MVEWKGGGGQGGRKVGCLYQGDERMEKGNGGEGWGVGKGQFVFVFSGEWKNLFHS